MNPSDDFYERLPLWDDFSTVADAAHYQAVPDDWQVAITDVVGSTKAVEEGRYKEVNTAGALAVIAVADTVGNLKFPFVFGGDGVTFLLPPAMLERAKGALANARRLTRELFDLTLRVGIVRVGELRAAGYSLRLAKIKLLGQSAHAAITGEGAERAEALVKDPELGKSYLLPDDYPENVMTDYSGFTCAWREIPSLKGETVSLILKPLAADLRARHELLKEILARIIALCGSEREYHPLAPAAMQVSLAMRTARRQAAINQRTKRGARYFGASLKAYAQHLFFRFFFQKDALRQRLIADADYQKFDGTLKMVLSCSAQNRKELERYCEELYSAGRAVYGLHISDKAVMTCFVRHDDHQVHFIDGTRGGYALAAKRMKERLKESARQ